MLFFIFSKVSTRPPPLLPPPPDLDINVTYFTMKMIVLHIFILYELPTNPTNISRHSKSLISSNSKSCIKACHIL